jgi:hypothetical protein
VEKAVEVGGLRRPVVFKVFAGFILASKFKQGGDEGRGSVLDSLIAGFVSLARLLQQLHSIVSDGSGEEEGHSIP